MKELLKELEGICQNFAYIKKQREIRKEQLEKIQKQKQQVINNISLRIETIDFIQKIALQQRQQVKQKVQKLITSCLQQVYDDSYSVQFNYGIKGSKTSVDIVLVRKCKDGLVVRRGIQGIGGGVADSISLPLKLIVLLNDKEYEKILITDEPGKHLDLQRVPKFANFVKRISEQLGVQVIMSSHHEVMDSFADTVNLVTIDGSLSSVQKIK